MQNVIHDFFRLVLVQKDVEICGKVPFLDSLQGAFLLFGKVLLCQLLSAFLIQLVQLSRIAAGQQPQESGLLLPILAFLLILRILIYAKEL